MSIELKAPEGWVGGDERIAEITKTATEKSWTPEQANEYLNHEHEVLTRAKTTFESQNKPKVPEKYELAAPKDSKLGPKRIEAIAEIAKKNGWSQERAAEHLNFVHEERNLFYAEAEEAHKAEMAEWEKAIREDKEVGGTRLKESAETADRGLEWLFPDQKDRDYLKTTGFLGMPSIFKALNKLGGQLKNDTLVKGSEAKPAEKKSLQERFMSGVPKS